MSAFIDSEELEAYRALRGAMARMSKRLKNVIAEAGDITLVQFEIVLSLGQEPDGMRMHELADLAHLSRSRLSYQVDQLERLGLVERVQAGDNERAVLARLTQAGKERLDRLQQAHFEFVRRHLFAHLSPEELATVSSIFTRVGSGLAEDG